MRRGRKKVLKTKYCKHAYISQNELTKESLTSYLSEFRKFDMV